MSKSLMVVPTNISEARKWIERHHSHHHAPQGGLCAVGVTDDGRLVCVAMLSRPVARLLNANPLCAEVNRVASDGTAKHAASMAIGAISRAAFALGYRRIVSYTLLGEAGTSYRAAGWWPTSFTGTAEGWHSRAGRTVVQNGEKVRWEYGPDAEPRRADIDAAVRDAVGNVPLHGRPETMPLFASGGAS